MVEIEIDSDGRIRSPLGVKLRLHGVKIDYPLPPADRVERLSELWQSIEQDREQAALRPWPEDDPIVSKYRRKGLIE